MKSILLSIAFAALASSASAGWKDSPVIEDAPTGFATACPVGKECPWLLYKALKDADAAGDTEGAQKLADYIQSTSQPATGHFVPDAQPTESHPVKTLLTACVITTAWAFAVLGILSALAFVALGILKLLFVWKHWLFRKATP